MQLEIHHVIHCWKSTRNVFGVGGVQLLQVAQVGTQETEPQGIPFWVPTAQRPNG